MKEKGISQLVVERAGKLLGIVHEGDLLRTLVSGQASIEEPIEKLVSGDYATVTTQTKLELLKNVLDDAKIAIATEGDRIVGIVAKIDLIDYLAHRAAAAQA